jgi:hypothetical protein
VEPLAQLIANSSQDPLVLRSAAHALGNIYGNDDAGTKQRAAGAVGSLVRLISIVWSICSASIEEAAEGAGAVEALVQLATSHQPGGATSTAVGGSSPVQQPAVSALCSKRGCRHRRLRLCGTCMAVRYCGERCQRLHWPEHHQAAQPQGRLAYHRWRCWHRSLVQFLRAIPSATTLHQLPLPSHTDTRRLLSTTSVAHYPLARPASHPGLPQQPKK